MEKKKGINPFWAFIAIILGWRLFKHFNFLTFKFSDPYFDVVYIIVFSTSIYLIVKDYNKQADK